MAFVERVDPVDPVSVGGGAMPIGVRTPHPGIQTWQNSAGATVLRLHYEADETKGSGTKTYVPDLKLWLSPWALREYNQMTNKAMYRQEYEVDFEARLGTLMYQLYREATLEKSFPMPRDWPRITVVDPHPRVPHAWLWFAIDPWGDRWFYRELWPSKICLRYEGGVLCGEPGNIPEDDHRYTTKEFVETVRWLESAENNPHLGGKAELIHKRLIDYAARGFKGSNDSEDKRSIQKRYEDYGNELGYPLVFADAVKDINAGVDAVNAWLLPRQVELPGGVFGSRSRAHIFEDACPELIHQLSNVRYEQQTSLQADRQDPSVKEINKRNHLADCFRYAGLDDSVYVPPVPEEPRRTEGGWQPMHTGLGY